jgi:hypothetical protein
VFIPWYGEDDLNVAYRECIMSYIDIMGFRRLIHESIDQPGTRDGILHSLREIDAAVNDRSIWHVDEPDAHLEPFGVHSFSDLIVRYRPLSEATDRKFAIFREILDICFAQARLIQHGTLIRGGLTIGKLYFDDKYVFGPGLVRAYELESRLAIYPRIIVEREIAQDLSEYWRGSPLLQDDVDGASYIAYLTPSTFAMFENVDFNALRHTHSVLTWHLEETKPELTADRQKLLWASRKFNELIDQFADMGKCSREEILGLKIDPLLYAKQSKSGVS